MNVLLQVLDDGRLTDGQGRTVDFKNAVIILTSNIGAAQMHAIEERVGLDAAAKRDLVRRSVMEEVRRLFRPEFLNRLDEIVFFTRLDETQIRSIVDIQLRRFETRLARRDLTLDVRDGAREVLARAGWDPQYGARPLKRAIQHSLEDPLARKVPGRRVRPGRRSSATGDRATSGESRHACRTVGHSCALDVLGCPWAPTVRQDGQGVMVLSWHVRSGRDTLTVD